MPFILLIGWPLSMPPSGMMRPPAHSSPAELREVAADLDRDRAVVGLGEPGLADGDEGRSGRRVRRAALGGAPRGDELQGADRRPRQAVDVEREREDDEVGRGGARAVPPPPRPTARPWRRAASASSRRASRGPRGGRRRATPTSCRRAWGCRPAAGLSCGAFMRPPRPVRRRPRRAPRSDAHVGEQRVDGHPDLPVARALLEHAGRPARRLHVVRVALHQAAEGLRLGPVCLTGRHRADHQHVAPALVPLRVPGLAVPLLA